MSAGAAPAAEGLSGAAPAHPARGDVIGRLRNERWHAASAGEHRRAAEIDAQIARLSAGTPASPARETAGRAAARTSRRSSARLAADQD